MRRAGRRWVPTWPWRRVLVLWLGLSVVIGVTAIAWLLPLPDGPWRLPMVAAKFLSPLTVFVAGVVLLNSARRPWLVVLGMVALLWAVGTIGLGCMGRACPKPPEYEYWRNVKVAVDIGLGGPRFLLSSDVEPCAFDCPYVIQLIPLAIGYLTYADALTTDDENHT